MRRFSPRDVLAYHRFCDLEYLSLAEVFIWIATCDGSREEQRGIKLFYDLQDFYGFEGTPTHGLR